MDHPTLDLVDKIVETVHKVLSKSPQLKTSRCLYTTSLISYFLDQHGVDHKIWQGTALWFSRRYVELRNEGIDPLDVTGLTEEEARQKVLSYRKEGVRFVACNANERLTPKDLGGHLAIMAHADGKYVFCDPTSYQFRRTKGPGRGNIVAPEIFRSQIDESDYQDPSTFTFVESKCLAYYKYEEIDAVRRMKELPDDQRSNTDLNPMRFPEILEEIKRRLTL